MTYSLIHLNTQSEQPLSIKESSVLTVESISGDPGCAMYYDAGSGLRAVTLSDPMEFVLGQLDHEGRMVLEVHYSDAGKQKVVIRKQDVVVIAGIPESQAPVEGVVSQVTVGLPGKTLVLNCFNDAKAIVAEYGEVQ